MERLDRQGAFLARSARSAPGGQVAEAYGVVRGQVIARWYDPHSVDPNDAAVFDAWDVKVFKLPAAIALGRCKRGIRERPSMLKMETSRINGRAPARPGSRRRGRPRPVVARKAALSPAEESCC